MKHFDLNPNYSCDISVCFRASEKASWVGVNAAREYLAELGRDMMLDIVSGMRISLTCDNQIYRFSGSVVSDEFQNLIYVLNETDSFQLEVYYSRKDAYITEAGYPQECETLVSCFQTVEDAAKNAFLSVSVTNGAPEDSGLLFALGVNHGRTFCGRVLPQPITVFPEDGNWHSPKEAIICCPEDLTGLDREAITWVIQELSALSEHDNLTDRPEELSFYLNNLSIHTSKEFEKFVRLTGELIRLMRGQCDTYAELVDWSASHSRILKVDFTERGDYSMTLASTD